MINPPIKIITLIPITKGINPRTNNILMITETSFTTEKMLNQQFRITIKNNPTKKKTFLPKTTISQTTFLQKALERINQKKLAVVNKLT